MNNHLYKVASQIYTMWHNKIQDSNEATNPVSQQLNDAIIALDDFVTSFQDRLRLNEGAKKRCNKTFKNKKRESEKQLSDEKDRAKKQLDDERNRAETQCTFQKNKIETELRREQDAIDSDLAEKKRQLNKANAEIDINVASFRNQRIGEIDSEVQEEKTRVDDQIRGIRGKIHELEDAKFPVFGKDIERWSVDWGGCLWMVILIAVIASQGAVLACLVFVAILQGARRLINSNSIRANKKQINQLLIEFDAFTTHKELEKREFIRTEYEPYKSQEERRKEENRQRLVLYEAAKQRERDALPFKLSSDDEFREAQTQCDNLIRKAETQHDELIRKYKSRHTSQIRAITIEHEREETELEQKRIEILVNIRDNFPSIKRPLSTISNEIRITQLLLKDLKETHLNRSASIPEFLALGQLHISFALPDGFANKEWNKDVPHLLDFPSRKPLYGEYCANSASKDIGSDDYLIRDLLMRLLFAMPAGMLQITAIDPMKMGTTLDMFSPLLDIEKLVPAGRFLTLSEDITKTLREHFDYIEDCLQRRFRGGINDWTEYNAINQEQPLPYKVLFIFGFPEQFWDNSITYLKTILEHGLRCGVLLVITINRQQIDPQRQPRAAQIYDWLKNSGESICSIYLPKLKSVTITANRAEPFVPLEKVSEYMQWIHAEYAVIEQKVEQTIKKEKHEQKIEELRKKETVLETEFWHTQDLWSQPSTDEISVPIGKDDHGNVVTFKLNDTAAHCLLAGQSGSGKSVLLHVMIQGLAHRYSPEDINFYLMDYKDGVEFNRYAKTQIPHTRLVVASKAEAEYGITVLEHLQNELTRRNALFGNHDVSDYKGYREKGHALPRVLLIIDEFQVLYQQSDAITRKVNDLFSDILARGRSAGIHVLLATQSARVLAPVLGFAGVKERLACRIALASSQDDSEYILGTPGCGNTAAVELRQANTDKTRYGILNTEGGHKAGNTKFLIPYPDREKCDTHQKFLAEEYVKVPSETSREVKIFDGSRLPQLPPVQEFETVRSNSKGVRMMLGEEFNFEAKPFVIDWEQKRRKNLCIAGADEAIRKGLLLSLLSSVDGQFERVVYFNTNPHFKELDLSIANLPLSNLEQKRFDWDCGIDDILADFKEKKTLLIVDPLDEAEEFHPPANFAPLKEGTPAHSLKQFLENAPLYGSYTVAFVDSWTQFKKQFKDSLPSFELRIGFQLNVNDAGDLTGMTQFKGLESNAKAVFANLQRNETVLFRPFVVGEE